MDEDDAVAGDHPRRNLPRCSRRHRWSASAAALCMLLAPHAEPAGASQLAATPRIGLVLSGGGARGAAHIGVLKVLEELRVPVHCVAGTSMGAVVGAGYAAGNPLPALERLVLETDWRDVFRDQPPRSELAVRRRVDEYKGLAGPEFGLRDGSLLLPRGLLAGVAIDNVLRQLVAPAAGIEDFDRLPIPFRAVAADLESGQEVVLASGGLRQALRASMAIPGVLSPVEHGTRLLVDGGIANNLPVDVARSTCADVVIAVNLGTQPLKRDDIASVLNVVGQLTNLLGKQNVDRQLAALGDADVLVAPDLGDISAASFERNAEAIAIGERAARAVAPALARYSLPEDAYRAVRTAQLAQPQPLGQVDEIRFEGLQRTSPEVLRGLLRTRPGEELEQARLAADLRRIYGRGDYEAVDYRIEQLAGRRALVISVRENGTGPDYLRFGVGLAAVLGDDTSFNLRLGLRRTWLNRLGAEWIAEAQVGRDNYLFTELHQPLVASGRVFAAPYARLGQSNFGVFDGGDRVAEYRVRDARVGLDVGATVGTWGELRAGPMWRQVDAAVDTGSPVLPSLDVRVQGVRASWYADTLDTPWFPRSGQRTAIGAFATTDAGAGQESYRRLEAAWTGAASAGQHTAELTVAGGSGLGARLPAYEGFSLGGPFRLTGYRIGQFLGDRYALVTLRYYNRQLQLPASFGSGTFLGGTIEAGRIRPLSTQPGSEATRWSVSAFAAAETVLGPAAVGLGFGGSGRLSVYLVLGTP